VAARWPGGHSIDFVEGLTLLLIGLKLAAVGEVADVSWWWVISPLWIDLLFTVVTAFFVAWGKEIKKIRTQRARANQW
jgi:hypothetical protein